MHFLLRCDSYQVWEGKAASRAKGIVVSVFEFLVLATEFELEFLNDSTSVSRPCLFLHSAPVSQPLQLPHIRTFCHKELFSILPQTPGSPWNSFTCWCGVVSSGHCVSGNHLVCGVSGQTSFTSPIFQESSWSFTSEHFRFFNGKSCLWLIYLLADGCFHFGAISIMFSPTFVCQCGWGHASISLDSWMQEWNYSIIGLTAKWFHQKNALFPFVLLWGCSGHPGF